jgi:hypothetical protein
MNHSTPRPRPTPRRPGAQPGNLNALTHGFYSRRLKKKDLAGTEDPVFTTVKEEIVLLRIFLRRVVEMGEDADLTYPETLTLFRTLCAGASNINSLIKTEQLIGRDDPTIMDDLNQALKEVMEELEAKNSLPPVPKPEK